VLLTGINALSARSYGESEFWLATIKVVTVVVFLIAGIAMIFGVLGGNSPGVSNWTVGEAPFVGGAPAVLAIFMVAGFSFPRTGMLWQRVSPRTPAAMCPARLPACSGALCSSTLVRWSSSAS